MSTLKAILLVVLTALPLQVWGLDCSSASITLNTQEDVDTFQTTYGGGGVCDRVTGNLLISGNNDITDIDGLANLASVGGWLWIEHSVTLANIDGLANLTSVGAELSISGNAALTNIDSLANLTSVGSLGISYNAALTNVDGLSSLMGVGNDFSLTDNPLLSSCTSLSTLLDDIDDYDPGPGPGVAGIPDIGGDVILQGNSSPCNSIDSILGIIFKDGFEGHSN